MMEWKNSVTDNWPELWVDGENVGYVDTGSPGKEETWAINLWLDGREYCRIYGYKTEEEANKDFESIFKV